MLVRMASETSGVHTSTGPWPKQPETTFYWVDAGSESLSSQYFLCMLYEIGKESKNKIQARQQIVERLMSKEVNCLTKRDIEEISELTAGYSGADMKNLCQEASLGPIRSLGFIDIKYIQPDQVRPVSVEDFKLALTRIRASVSPGDLDSYVAWDKQYGSGGIAVSNANMKI